MGELEIIRIMKKAGLITQRPPFDQVSPVRLGEWRRRKGSQGRGMGRWLNGLMGRGRRPRGVAGGACWGRDWKSLGSQAKLAG